MGNVVLCYPSEMRKTIRYHSNTHHLRTSVYCSKDDRGDGRWQRGDGGGKDGEDSEDGEDGMDGEGSKDSEDGDTLDSYQPL